MQTHIIISKSYFALQSLTITKNCVATLTETNASHVPEVKSEKTEYVLVVSSLSNNSSLSPVLSEAKEQG